MAPPPGHVLWTGVILLSGLAWVRCEMRKSWKVKSSSSDVVTGDASGFAPSEPDDYGKVLAKLPRFEPDPVVAAVHQPVEKTLKTEEEKKEQEVVSEKAVKSSVQGVQPKNRLRSTYVANRSPSSVYNSMRESVKAAPFVEDHEPEIQIDDFSADEADEDEYDLGLDEHHDQKTGKEEKTSEDKYEEGYKMIEEILEEVKSNAEGETASKKEETVKSSTSEDFKKYDFGPVLNMTIDEPNNIVNVKLNENVLKDIFTGRGGGGGGGGGGKKVWKYAMPLFILPFLIQSAVIPFMLTTVKLFLFKSLMAGKLAIFLLMLGAFKNFTQKKDKEVYVKDIPERRYEPYNEWPYPYHSEGKSERGLH